MFWSETFYFCSKTAEAVRTSTYNLCFEQEYETYQTDKILDKNVQFLQVKFSIYLNRRVFVIIKDKVNVNPIT